jgi:hypothetical protein
VLSTGGDPRFRADDGSADPAVAAALSAFAAGQQSEQAALTALAGSRLLVPVVAVLTEAGGASGRPALKTDKNSDMAMPKLVGRDGRSAIPAFTCVEALARWQQDARPVPVAATAVWRAALEESCAVVIDVAGPVPLAVEGARLEALAAGAHVPPPWDDPDVQQLVGGLVVRAAGEAGSGERQVRFALRAPAGHDDLLVELVAPGDLDAAGVQAFVNRVGASVPEQLGFRLRRGIGVALVRPPG